ncbi:hypothetical protein E3U55_15875 [Filobacillus milosensis]|uniref:Uncharacterized protein n=1 Tax=Filobacillus milosensis TaxID=94137 RepID=A0A4Y8IEA1_9BACI|nr:hypothetical protein [Filobacillus milosensis]TFB13454.1 hypothetical protein E3U55_15875 [Filobacillus milosensis]
MLGPLIVVLGLIALVYLMVDDYYDLQKAAQRASSEIYTLLIKMTLWAFLFGILLEWRGLVKLIEKKFKFNWILFIPAVMLSVLMFIPKVYWFDWFGITGEFYIKMLTITHTHTALTILAGTLLIRSFSEK